MIQLGWPPRGRRIAVRSSRSGTTSDCLHYVVLTSALSGVEERASEFIKSRSAGFAVHDACSR